MLLRPSLLVDINKIESITRNYTIVLTKRPVLCFYATVLYHASPLPNLEYL